MFRDECTIEVRAGKGGQGLVSFRREKYVTKGGPDGGDGGDGGSVILVATPERTSLLTVGRRPLYKAANGRPGGPRDRTGAAGESLQIEVPVGTQVIDEEHGNLLRDLAEPGQELVLARGGKGGRGNAHFANSVRQAPRHSEPGRDGEHRRVRLELKLVAEVGLVGLPNAGKSTFLAAVSAARPKVADYPFTTLSPQVAIASVGKHESLCLADLPGLIEGAAEGTGLGHRFLKHVERCTVLLHLIDVSDGAEDPVSAFGVIEGELERYSSALAARPRLLVASKVESEAAEARADELEAALGRPVLRISSHTGRGVPELLARAFGLVRGARASS